MIQERRSPSSSLLSTLGILISLGLILVWNDATVLSAWSVSTWSSAFELQLTPPTSSSVESSAPLTSHCWLDPPWGTNESGKPTISSKANNRACAIRIGQSADNLMQPYSTAATLTCPNNQDDTSSFDSDDITVVLLYYANPSVLAQQMEYLSEYPTHLKARLRLLVVDDGSPAGLQAQEYLQAALTKAASMEATGSSFGFPVRVVRIMDNIIWNIPGAQNLGVHLADTSRILLLDLDSFLQPSMFERLLSLSLSSADYDHISHRFFIPGPSNSTMDDKSHNKIAFLRKDSYWSAGGYDEDFVGHYGHDDYAFWYRFGMNPRSFFDKNVKRHSDRLYVFYRNSPEPCDIWKSDTFHLEKCEKAIQSLPRPPKREDIPVNRKLFFRRKFTQCWSNLFLRFDWTTDIQVDSNGTPVFLSQLQSTEGH